MDSAGTGDLKGLPISSEAIDGVDPFHSPAWYPIMSGNQVEGFTNSCPVLADELANPHFPVKLENQAQFVQFPSGSCLGDVVVRKIPGFGSGNLSEMVGSFGHGEGPSSHSSIPPIQGIGNQRGSSYGKKKRKNVEEEKQENLTGKDTVDGPENKGKVGYIHVRAKRGQATNSHSLAERVRRERISERMRLLQDLVPGCNKITGKAVMLDEIINYVQSLQQQVEFLSMKLATVNPELNLDIQQILSKDMLHLRDLSPANTVGIGPGLSSSHLFQNLPQEIIHSFPAMATPPSFPFHPLSQSLWNSELQSILQTGLDSNQSSGGSPMMHGLSQMEP